MCNPNLRPGALEDLKLQMRILRVTNQTSSSCLRIQTKGPSASLLHPLKLGISLHPERVHTSFTHVEVHASFTQVEVLVFKDTLVEVLTKLLYSSKSKEALKCTSVKSTHN